MQLYRALGCAVIRRATRLCPKGGTQLQFILWYWAACQWYSPIGQAAGLAPWFGGATNCNPHLGRVRSCAPKSGGLTDFLLARLQAIFSNWVGLQAGIYYQFGLQAGFCDFVYHRLGSKDAQDHYPGFQVRWGQMVCSAIGWGSYLCSLSRKGQKNQLISQDGLVVGQNCQQSSQARWGPGFALHMDRIS